MKKSTLFIIVILCSRFISNAAVGDYRTRAGVTGNWNGTSVWQKYYDPGSGNGWYNVSSYPTSSDGTITILAGCNITITADITLDEANVKGILSINAGVNVTLPDGSGYEIDVDNTSSSPAYMYINGTLICKGSIHAYSGQGYIYFNDGSWYRHAVNGGTIGVCIWDTLSTCEITGDSTDTSGPTNFDQTFGNLVWNCPGQSVVINLSGIPRVANNFTISSTGSGILTLSTSVSVNLFVGGNYSQSNGIFYPSNGAGNDTLFIGGNFSLSGGYLGGPSSGSGSATVVFMKNGTQTYTKSGGATMNNKLHFIIKPNSILDAGTSVIGDHNYCSGNFTLSAEAGLKTAHSQGISTDYNVGCVQTNGTKNYNNAAHYTYYASGAQYTGNGLPTTITGSLTIGSSSNTTALSLSRSTAITGSIIIVNGNLANSGISFNSTGILEYRGTSTQTMGNYEWPSSTVPNLKINNSAGVNMNASKIVSTHLNLYNGALSIGGNTLTLNGTISRTSGTITGGNSSNITFSGSGSTALPAVLNGLKNLIISRNGYTISLTGNVNISGTMTMTEGSFTLSGGVLSYGAYATLKYNASTGAQTCSNGEFPASGGPYNLYIDNPGSVLLHASRSIPDSVTLNQGQLSIGANTLTVNGFIIKNSGGLTGGNTSNIVFGENAIFASLPTVTNGLKNLEISRSSGLQITGAVTVYGILTLNKGSITFNGGSLVYGPNACLQYNGSSPQLTSDIEFPATGGPKNLWANNTSGLTLHASRTVTGTLKLIKGTFYIGSGNTLTLNDSILVISGSLAGGASSNLDIENNAAAATSIPNQLELQNLTLNRSNGIVLNGDLDIQGTLTLSAGILRIGNRKITLHNPVAGNPGLISANLGSSVEIAGSSTGMNIGPTENIRITGLNNLTISNTVPSGILLNGELTLTGSLTIDASSKLIINPGKTLTVQNPGHLYGNECLVIRSDSTGTGSLVDNGFSYYSGATALEERYIRGNRFHLISIPISNTIEGGTGPGQTGNIFLHCSLDNYDESSDSWLGMTQDDNVKPGRGYVTKYFYGGTAPYYKIINFSGTLNTGSQIFNITRMNNGYNLIPNPYPSSVDWDNMTGWGRTDLVDNGGYDIWIWNPSPGVNNWGTYNSGSHIGTNGVTNLITTGQSFFIQAERNGKVTAENSVRTHSSQEFLKDNNPVANLLRMKVSNGLCSDEAVVYFDLNGHGDGGTVKWFSMTTESPEIYFPKNSTNYSVTILPSIGTNEVVPINFKPGSNGDFVLTFDGAESFGQGTYITLEDLKDGIFTDLLTDTIYSFTGQAADNHARFLLHFSQAPPGIPEETMNSVHVFSHNNYIYINNGERRELNTMIFNMAGQMVYKQDIPGKDNIRLDIKFPSGIYIVRLSGMYSSACRKIFIQETESTNP